MESAVIKHTSEDTQDSGVQFINQWVQAESVPNKDPDVSQKAQFYTLHYVTC